MRFLVTFDSLVNNQSLIEYHIIIAGSLPDDASIKPILNRKTQ